MNGICDILSPLCLLRVCFLMNKTAGTYLLQDVTHVVLGDREGDGDAPLLLCVVKERDSVCKAPITVPGA